MAFLRRAPYLALALCFSMLLVDRSSARADADQAGRHAGSTKKAPQSALRPAKDAAAPHSVAAADDAAAPDLPSAIGSQEPGWLYKGSDLTPDPDWYFGTLPNGVRYAVRKNGVPPGQAAVRVRIDAGSLYETESERGFAHLIEHLTFRGSVYVPDGEAKRVWQRMGTIFGSDTNAQTTPTQTVYKLDLPGATPAGLDESLKILSGMMEKPNITSQALDAERPVVLAEQREQPGPQVRVSDALRATLFAGQPLADRTPIGNIKTLEAATADTVRAFHDRWYRPERTVVIVSGDVDPAVVEKLIQKNFRGWKADGPPPADPDFGAPGKQQVPDGSNVLVEPSLPPRVTYAVLRPWHYRDDTVIFNQKRLVDLLATRVINRRLETRARSGARYLEANVSLQDVSRSANGTFVDMVPLDDDWAAALREVRAVIADAMASPPSQADIDRELAEFDAAMKNEVDTARAEAGAKQADDLVEALDIRETVTSPETAYAILQDARAKGMFSPDALLESTRRIFTGDATRAFLTLRAPNPGAAQQLADAMAADVSGLAGKRVEIASVDFSKLPPLGKPGEVTKRTSLNDFGIEKVTFANGVNLMVFPNPSEAGRVYIRVRFGGGFRQLPANRITPLWTGNLALVASGIGSFGQDALDALANGRRIGMDFGVDDDAFTFGAATNPSDLADNLFLIADKLEHPGWDPRPLERARAVALTAYAGYDSAPGGVLSRDLEGLLHGGDARWRTPTPADMKAVTAKSFRAFWAPILASGPIEVSVFGDIKADDAIAAVARSFGAMKPRKPAKLPDAPVKFPKPVSTPVKLTHGGPDNQAVAVIAWPTGGGIDGTSDSRKLDVLAAIFSDRLFDRLRSEAGASYSPSVASTWPVGLASGGRVAAIGQVPPDKVDFFFKLSREIAADLAAKPIDGDELKRTVVPMLQYISRVSTGNTFWLNQLGGGSFDNRRFKVIETLGEDFRSMTPTEMQRIAAKYLRPDTEWTLAVLPRDEKRGPAR